MNLKSALLTSSFLVLSAYGYATEGAPVSAEVTVQNTAESEVQVEDLITPVEEKKVAESEILLKPVEAKASATTATGPSTSGRVLATTLAILALGLGGFIYLRRLNLKGVSKASQIKILTQHYLGPKKSIAVVRVAGESLLIGVTDHQINLLKTLSLLDEDLENLEKIQKGQSFKSQLNEEFQEEAAQEEFNLASLKSSVSQKLKNMRNL